MTSTRSYKQRLARVHRHWGEEQYDRALEEVEDMLRTWSGNAQLYVLRANLVQLQEKPAHTLEDVKHSLQQAVELEKGSPSGAIELGHFLDAVEDNPRAASRAYAEGIESARRLLIDGLLGQAKALIQVDKKEQANRCLMEALYLVGLDPDSETSKSADLAPDIMFRDPTGRIHGFQLKGPFASQIEELLKEVFPNRSA